MYLRCVSLGSRLRDTAVNLMLRPLETIHNKLRLPFPPLGPTLQPVIHLLLSTAKPRGRS